MGVVLVTGSSGLVGSACVRHFARLGCKVYGLDGNQRRDYFGADGDTGRSLNRLRREVAGFVHQDADVRDRGHVQKVVDALAPDAVIHCAAQPSHDWASKQPAVDWDTNAGGTLNLLEAVRLGAPRAAFVLASTNKVYGDACNRLPTVELETRHDFHPAAPESKYGLGEWLNVDQCRHSIFGASKLAADVLTQEYARTFGLNTGVFRMGCVTGAAHAGAELHGFLAYLARCCREGRYYRVQGHGGKQVRDQLHADDVAAAFAAFAADPKPGAVVYNLGGGRQNSVSVLEAIDAVQDATGKRLDWEYHPEERGGDHRVWYTDNGKFTRDYPAWSVQRDLASIIEELCRQ